MTPNPLPSELTFTCILDAPRELVFRCMIEPEHLTHFWGPVGTSAPVDKITIDPRPGGVFEVTMVNDSDGAEYPMRGVYIEVVEPEKLVWVERDSEMTTTSLVHRSRRRTHRSAHSPDQRARWHDHRGSAGRLQELARSLRRISRDALIESR